MTNTAISRLARLSGAAVVPFFYRRRADNRGYVLSFQAPLDDFPTDDPAADTRRLVVLLEEAIRRAPEQYLWSHKRFRDRPPPLPDAYAHPASAASKAPAARHGGLAAACVGLLAALISSASVMAPIWAKVDTAVHASLSSVFATSDALLWTLASEQWIDGLTLLAFAVLFVHRFMRGATQDIRDGLTVGLATGVVLLACLLPAALIDDPRGGLTAALLVTAWLWGRAAGVRFGLATGALAGAFALLHVAAATIKVSDLIAGAGVFALLTVAVLAGTRVGPRLYATARRGSDALLSASSRLSHALATDDAPAGSLRKQLGRGVCIGAAHLVPGIGGGSAALALGVYQRLLRALARLDGEWLRLLIERRFVEALRRLDILFVAPIVVGILCAPLIFSRVVPLRALIAQLPEMTYGFFFGMIAASIAALLMGVAARRVAPYGCLVAGVALGCSVVMFVPASTPDSVWFVFLCGLLAVAAVLMPGLSGALVLLVFGKHAEAIDAVARFDLAFLLPLAGGAVAGAVLFSRAMTWLLERYRQHAMLMMVGVLGGSLLAIWPFQEWIYVEVGGREHLISATPYVPQELDRGVLMGIVMMLVGAITFRPLERSLSRAGGTRG